MEEDEEKASNGAEMEEMLTCPLSPSAASTAGLYHYCTTGSSYDTRSWRSKKSIDTFLFSGSPTAE